LLRVRACGCGLVVLLLSGCATWSRHGIAPRAPGKIRVAVLPVEVAVRVARLRNIETPPPGAPAPPEEGALIQEKLRAAADEITRDVEDRLASSYFFEVASDSDVRRALAVAGSTAPLSADRLQALGRALDVQAVLSVRLSGYGSIKRRWLFYLVGSGLAEGLAQGIAAAVVIGSPWAAVGIGAEEALQETAEWGGGAYVFGRVWAPVILEGSLTSAADGKTVWSGTALESSDREALKRLPPERRERREVRLRVTAARAAASLVKDLDRKAWANLKSLDAAAPR